jgi:aspartate aminotransferase
MQSKLNYAKPSVSNYFAGKVPNDVRLGSIKFSKREDNVDLINAAIGNVSMPMHPKMQERMRNIGQEGGGFSNGVVKYESTSGNEETKVAFKNIIKQMGFDPSDLEVLVTDGASLAMEIMLLGVCGELGEEESSILVIDPTYTNYNALAKRLGRKTISIQRTLNNDGHFTFPDIDEIEKVIRQEKPNAVLMIPYDNPTGQMYNYEMIIELAKLCVKYNLWFVSDEAYRGLFYDENRELLSVWGVTNEQVPGIEGRRISIESSSKVWNACGLRIGALITDSALFYEKMEAEYTSNLSANSIGQHIFGALAYETREELFEWLKEGQSYYRNINKNLYTQIKKANPDFIVSQPESSIYIVVDVKNATKSGFDSSEFVSFCAEKGKVMIEGVPTTLLVAPMSGFYNTAPEENPGKTQFRLSFCEPTEKMKHVPYLLNELLIEFEKQR